MIKPKKVFLNKILLGLIVVLSFSFFTVSAYTPKDLSMYAKELSEAEKQIVEGGIEIKEQQIATVFNGVVSDKTAWNNHTVDYVTTPKNNTTIKPVVWSAGSLEDWAPKTVFEIAADYEKTHPGYIVVGAINGDFYYNKEVEGLNDKTFEPCNYHVQEGDVLRAAYYTDDVNFGLLGFNENNKYSYGAPKKSSSMYLKKVENNITSEIDVISGYNIQPTADGTYVFTKELVDTINLTGYKVYKGTIDLYRKFNEGLFVKGNIIEVVNTTNLSSVSSGNFYIATSTEELKVNDYVKVEYNLEGEVSSSLNVIGYIYQCLQNGKTLGQNMPTSVLSGYLSKTYTRAAIGFKEDGTIVLMSVDGTGNPSNNREGATLFQTGELLRVMGCVDGFNLDGGGSVTLAARIDGKLTLLNNPADGSVRKVGNAILLVMPDPKIKVLGAEGNTIKFKKTTNLECGTLENVKVKFDNRTYDFIEDELVVTGLDKNTEYKIKIEYDIRLNDGKLTHGITENYYRTTENFAYPILEEFVESRLDKNSVTFKYKIEADMEDIVQIYIKNGTSKTTLDKLSGRVEIEGLDTTIENKFILVVELKVAGEMELAALIYEANSIPTDKEDIIVDDPVIEDDSSGCKKTSALLVVSLISLTAGLIVLRKRK